MGIRQWRSTIEEVAELRVVGGSGGMPLEPPEIDVNQTHYSQL